MARAPISVVIPAHNEERFLQQAIASVHAQTLPVAEVIVVADACTDDTKSIGDDLGARIVEIEIGNISAARNAGIRAANQKWIAFLDADDYWEPNKIELQWKALEKFPEAAIVSCDYFVIFEGEKILPDERLLSLRRENDSTAIVTEQATYFPKVDGRMLTLFEIGPQAVMVKRDVFDRAGWFDEELVYLQDVEFFARALRDHSFAMVEQPLVYRRMRPDSHSANGEAKWSAFFSIVERMLRRPDEYVPLAGEHYREHLKFVFAGNERVLANKRRRLADNHLSKPNQ